jgi:regulator of sirC expression with transglutaminase-like and TPR domain
MNSVLAARCAALASRFLLAGCWLAFALSAQAGVTARTYDSQSKTIRSLLDQPNSQIDLAVAKVTVDQMVDSEVDKDAVLRQLDQMASEVRATFTPFMSNSDRFWALYTYLYQPPALSGRLPFRYNFEDDTNPRAKLLSVYLSTHKGNCISMPLLFVILGQKLNIPVAISTAPAHLYVKFKGNDGQWQGFEATSGSRADDDRWRALFPRLTRAAIDNGIYLQPLSKRETVAVIAESLLEHYQIQDTLDSNEAQVKLGFLLLDYYPKNVVAMVHVYLGYRSMRQKLFVEKYPTPGDIPVELRPKFMQIEEDSMRWGLKAKSLGYLPSTPAQDAAYRERIKRAKAENGIQ